MVYFFKSINKVLYYIIIIIIIIIIIVLNLALICATLLQLWSVGCA